MKTLRGLQSKSLHLHPEGTRCLLVGFSFWQQAFLLSARSLSKNNEQFFQRTNPSRSSWPSCARSGMCGWPDWLARTDGWVMRKRPTVWLRQIRPRLQWIRRVYLANVPRVMWPLRGLQSKSLHLHPEGTRCLLVGFSFWQQAFLPVRRLRSIVYSRPTARFEKARRVKRLRYLLVCENEILGAE